MNPSIEDALIREIQRDIERDIKPKDSFQFSMMGRCPRAQIGIRAGLLRSVLPDDRARYKMWLGTVIHRAMQKKLLKAGYLDPTFTMIGEVEGVKDLVIEATVEYRSYKGHPDGVVQHSPPGPAVVEIKTCDDRAVKYELPEHYKWQGFGYCLAVGIKTLVIFQIGLSQGLRREVVLPFTDEWRNKLEVEIGQMDQAWEKYLKELTLPACTHRIPWEDKLCPFLEVKSPDPIGEWHPFKQTEDEKALSEFLDKEEK